MKNVTALPGFQGADALFAVEVVVLVILLGVVLPAVWSAQPQRRQAALRVLKLIMKFVRGESDRDPSR